MDECTEPPKKKPRLYNLTAPGGTTGLQEDGEGTLVINTTSDSGQVCYTSEGQQVQLFKIYFELPLKDDITL